MDLKQLRALVAVAETKSVTRAAALLNRVQPAISRQLQLLEQDMQVELFERGRHGMTLTREGEILVDYARRALNELDRARAEILPKDAAIQGIVTIGLLPSIAELVASPLLTAVAALYPNVHLRLSTGFAGHLQQWLESGEVDAALLYDPKPSAAISVSPLLTERLWVVGLAQSDVCLEAPVTLARLAKAPLILPSAPHGLRTLVDHAFASARLQMQLVAETNALGVQRSLVRSGHGLTVLPAIAVIDDIARGDLRAAPLCEPALTRTIVLALPAGRRAGNAITRVVALLTQKMEAAVRQGSWADAQWIV